MQAPHRTSVPLSAYVEALRAAQVLLSCDLPQGEAEPVINFITADSREVVPGTLFVCKGRAFKRAYLVASLAAGAVAYLAETPFEGIDAPCVQVCDVRRAMGVLADMLYSHPSGDIAVCAFTGTKGKTTCAYYLKSVLDARAQALGAHATPIFSSVTLDDGVTCGPSKLTTPEAFELEAHIANAVSVGARELVMEASSQALKYDRTYGVDFAVVGFTNIGEDHISPIEHPDFEDYFSSKLKVFSQARCGVVSLDIDHADRVLAAAQAGCERVVTCSERDEGANVFLERAQMGPAGVEMAVRTPRGRLELTLPSPSHFNALNALLVVGMAEGLGVEHEHVRAGLEAVSVPGRMQMVPSPVEGIVPVVDFAHNGMSLEIVLRELRQNYPGHELCCVFGATGGKGIDRRDTMGVAAGKHADRIVITEDDPGPEPVEDICATIAARVDEQGNDNWVVECDRERAIRLCLAQATRPAVVLVAGKGCEDTMVRAGGPVPWEGDALVLERALNDLAKGALDV